MRAWAMPGVRARAGFSKATAGEKRLSSNRKQTPSLNAAAGLSYKKLNSMLMLEDIKVPSLLSVIMQDGNSIICHWFDAM